MKWFDKKAFTTLFVDGNHENFNLLNNYPVEYWNGGKVHKINNSVIHLMRGQVYELEGRTFFTFGGAKSSDIEYRKENLSWWIDEMPSKDEKVKYKHWYFGHNHLDENVTSNQTIVYNKVLKVI